MEYSLGLQLKRRVAVSLFGLVCIMAVTPLAAGTWSKVFDDALVDNGTDVVAVSTGGLVAVGQTDGDAWMMRLSAAGGVTWEKAYTVGSSSEPPRVSRRAHYVSPATMAGASWTR